MSDYDDELDELQQYADRFIDLFPYQKEDCRAGTVLDLFRHHRDLEIQAILPWTSSTSGKEHCFVLFETEEEARAATQIGFNSHKAIRLTHSYLGRLADVMSTSIWDMLRENSYSPPPDNSRKRSISEVDEPSSSDRPTARLSFEPPVGSVVISNSEYTELKTLAVETSSLRPQLANAQLQVTNSAFQLASFKSQIANAQSQLLSYQSQYANSQSLLANAQSQLATSQSHIAQLRSQLALAADQWNKRTARLQLAESQLNRPKESRAIMTEPQQESTLPKAVNAGISTVDTWEAEEIQALKQALQGEVMRRRTAEEALTAKEEQLSAYQAVSASLKSMVTAVKRSQEEAGTSTNRSDVV